MALTNNPNKNKSIEKKWRKEARKRFAELKKQMRAIPLISDTLVNIDAVEQFNIDAFMAEFERTTIGLILGEPWQNKYQTSAYSRGIDQAANRIGGLLPRDPNALASDASLFLSLPIHSNELEFQQNRANDSLDKWVTALLADTRSILHENLGIVPIDDIYQAIADRINVTTSRAEAIATTEIAQAAQRAGINQIQLTSVATGEEMDVRWITVRDSRVRHLHASWHGKKFTPEQAARNTTISPWNCRCGVEPARPDDISTAGNDKFNKERSQLLKREEKAVA